MENLARELQTAEQNSEGIGLCQCPTPSLRASPGELVPLSLFYVGIQSVAKAEENDFSFRLSSSNLFCHLFLFIARVRKRLSSVTFPIIEKSILPVKVEVLRLSWQRLVHLSCVS